MFTDISADRLAKTKRAYTTRNVPEASLRRISSAIACPSAGDVVLARVTAIGQHRFVELPTSRKATLFVGDEVILVYGNRYAPDQFEAYVPDDLGPCAMVAAGGVAGRVAHAHYRMDEATQIEPLGLFVTETGAALNLSAFSLPAMTPRRDIPVIAVVGGSMNAGKTTTAAALVHGLAKAGLRVGAAKITGTGAGNDGGLMRDAGAIKMYDFTDAGLVTTFKAPQAELERVATTLVAALEVAGAEVAVVEIADGLFQEETAWLVQHSLVWRRLVDGYLFAAESAASAASGVHWLRQHGLLLGVSGLVSASPLAAREATNATGYPCLRREDLWSPDQARTFMHILARKQASMAA